MASEGMSLQTISQLLTTGINTFAKQIDIFEIIMKNNRDELEQYAADSVGKGEGVVKINVPTEDILSLQGILCNNEIPFAMDISKDVSRAVNDLELTGYEDPVTAIYVKDIDVAKVTEIKTKLMETRERIKEVEDARTAEKVFEGVETCFIDNLNPIQTEIIAREFEKQGVNFKRVYDKETKTMSIEVEAAMFQRLDPNTFSRAEKALYDSIIKGYSDTYVRSLKLEMTKKRAIKDLITDEIENNGETAKNYTIYDASNPKRNIQFNNGAVIINGVNDKTCFLQVNDKKSEETLNKFIEQMDAPSVMKTSVYMEAIENYRMGEKLDIENAEISTPQLKDAFEKYQASKGLLTQDYKIRFIEEVTAAKLNDICEKTREEQLIDFKYQPNKDTEHQAMELKIPNSDKVFETVVSLSPQTEKMLGKTQDEVLIKQLQDEILSEINLKINELKVTNPKVHTHNPDYIYITEHEQAVLENASMEDLKPTPKAYDNADKLFDPAYDRDHDRLFDKGEVSDIDADGTLDIYEDQDIEFSDEDDPFGSFD